MTTPSHRALNALTLVLGGVTAVVLLVWLVRPPHSVPVVAAPVDAAASAPVGTAAVPVPRAANPADERRREAIEGRWDRLSPRQQRILEPLQSDWAQLLPEQRRKWVDLSTRFPSFTLDEQERIQARMGEWARMSPAERGQARLNFQEIRQLSQKERLEMWEAYQGLEAHQRKSLTEKAQSQPVAAAAPKRTDTPTPVPKSGAVVADALPSLQAPKVSGPAVVQAPLGATTTLVNRMPPTAATAAPVPKVAATSPLVDPTTLLPQRPKAAVAPDTEDDSASPHAPAASAPASDP